MWWIKLPVVLLLLAMAWQDWKFRAIAIWLFVLLGAGLVFLKCNTLGTSIFFSDLKLNLIFLALQLGALFGYFAIKERRFVNLFAGYFGEGDLLFLLLLASYLSFFNFLAFHVFSLLLALLLGLCLSGKHKKIPLAGIQAFFLVVLMGIDHLSNDFSLIQDFWILSFYT